MISKPISNNFDTLCRAISSPRDSCLMEVKDRTTGEIKVAVCAVNWEPDGSGASFVPLAIMIDCDPYERYAPPDPDNPDKFIEEDVPQ